MTGPEVKKSILRRWLYHSGASPQLAHSIHEKLIADLGNRPHYVHDVKKEVLKRAQSLHAHQLSLSQWKTGYQEIFRANFYGREVQRDLVPGLNETSKSFLEMLQTSSPDVFQDAWGSLDRRNKAASWQGLALWLLENDAKLLLSFLLITTRFEDKPSFRVIGDCLRFVEKFHCNAWLKKGEVNAQTFQNVIEACLHPDDWPIINPPEKHLWLFIRKSGQDSVNLAFQRVQDEKREISGGTLLCFVRRFTEFGDIDRALKALVYIPKLRNIEFTMQSEGVTRHVCKLLTLDTIEDGPDGRNFRILPQLLEMGVKPDRDMMNIVLSNAAKIGDHQLLTDILKFMKDHQHQLDSHTYLVLLEDALAREDRGAIDLLVQEIETVETLRTNPYLASKIFHSHYLFKVKHMDPDADKSNLLFSMLDMYNRLYDIKPLEDLLIVPPHYTARSKGVEKPSTVILYIALATYLRCTPDISKTRRIYSRFQELLREGDPVIASMAESDHAYNAFLSALRHNRRTLQTCVQIVEDMLHPTPEVNRNGEIIDHVKPTTRTWTLLLCAFIFNRQFAGAEKIREMMSKHNIEYSDVTWNTIVNGYANMPDVSQTAKSIKAMEQAGFPIDSHTMKPLRYLRDPEALWAAIDALDRQYSTADLEPEPELEPGDEKDLREQLIDNALEKLAMKSKSMT